MSLALPVYGTFSQGRATAAGGTAFRALIPPFMGLTPYVFNLTNVTRGVTHLSRIIYTTGGTAHQIGVMRPFNYTTVSSAAAINQAVINITADPGVYSTNMLYPNANSGYKPAAVADNAIAASDVCAYQLVDGTWILDTVSSVATLAITMATAIPNITGGGVAAGTRFYFFGVIGDKDPNTGFVNPQTTTIASATRADQFQDQMGGGIAALHIGDPLVFYSPNTTAAGELDGIHGYYSDR